MNKDDTSGLTQLGSNVTEYKYNEPSVHILEGFKNQHPDADYWVNFQFHEFTSLCPKTGQPDTASVFVEYVPGDMILETKSVKLYFFAYREHGAFMESITNKILRDFVAVCGPKQMKVTMKFAPRGGIKLRVEAFYHHRNGFCFHPQGKSGRPNK